MANVKVFRKELPPPENATRRARMNSTESAYALRLEAMKRNGMIVDYAFESVTLKLAHDTRYTPDFCVWYGTFSSDGSRGPRIEFHETKGFMRDDARVKLHVAAKQNPWATFYLCRKTKDSWTVTEVER